jgi:hypothetical protein
MENIQHDYFIWEENSYTEQKKNDKNNNEFVHCATTTTTKNDLTQKDWKDITNPKERKKMREKAYYEDNKEKLKVKQKAYREANKDKRKVQMKAYRETNKEKAKEYSKVYWEVNKDKKKAYDKNWNENNKERLKVYKKIWGEVNKDKLKVQQKTWREDNKDKINNYSNNRRKTDIQFKLTQNLRARLNSAIKCNYKAGSAVKDLGCTVEQLKQHLESKFQSGMTWDNWALDGWHIDHIKPLASFDLTDRKQLLEACHYTNLQPLWAKDNLSKNDSVSNL